MAEHRLYDLLPAYVRNRDWYEGEPLRALMAALQAQHDLVEEDIWRLYDDWFVETCDTPVLPRLAELLGVRGLDPGQWVPEQRALVANTQTYRRLKGTLAALERVGRDATGWPCRAVAGRDRVAATWSLAQTPACPGPADLRDGLALSHLDGPFETARRTVQVSGPEAGEGPAVLGCRPAAVGLSLWPERHVWAAGRTARRVAAGCYAFHPLGADQPLLNRPRALGEPPARVEARHLPARLARAALAAELERRAAGVAPGSGHLGAEPSLCIRDPRSGGPIPWHGIEAADLSAWRRPPGGAAREIAAAGRRRGVVVAVDPELGRLAFAEDHPPAGPVQVDCCYAQGADLGGGPYPRASVLQGYESPAALQEAPRYARLDAAAEARPSAAEVAVIRIEDSATYGGWSGLDLPLRAEAGRTLVIAAVPGAAPAFIGDLPVEAEPGGRILLEGLLIGGRLRLRGTATVELRHCTVHPEPGGGGIDLEGGSLHLEKAIVTGPLRLAGARLDATDSILGGRVHAAAGGRLLRVTALAPVELGALELAQDTLFASPVTVAERGAGACVRCYLPPGSATPPRSACLPDGGPGRRWLRPRFQATAYGQPGYARLAASCPREIQAGGAGGTELGAFGALRDPHRRANLVAALEEYLPLGAAAGVYHAR